LLIAAAVYLVLATASIDVNWSRVADGPEPGWAFIASFFNPISSPAAPISARAYSKA
jgi:phosphonate transport system permease protein